MPSRKLLLALTAGVGAAWRRTLPAPAGARGAPTGEAGRAGGGPREGGFVGAKRAGSMPTISVVSDNTGKFACPASKLEPGRYSLAIRAVGYDLDGPKT